MDSTTSKPLDGFYKSLLKKSSYIKIAGEKVSSHEAGRDVIDNMKIELGEFGTADEAIRELSAKEKYNINLVMFWDKNDPEKRLERFGVISDDRERIFFENPADKSQVDVRERITKEEADEIEKSGLDPILAPPGPYTIQPGKQGRLVWITGPPGAGKSTSAQLLARLHGFVYYEVDCFIRLRNPFIPLEGDNPSLVINNQKALCGEGIEERKEVCGENGKLWGKMFRDEELVEDDWKMIERFSEMLGEDISSQRRRIGGDWVVAGCLPQRRMRDLVKANLEKELVIVCLVMEQEVVRERISSRHQANEAVVRGIMNISGLCRVEDGEDRVVVLKVDKSMTREDVITEILKNIEG